MKVLGGIIPPVAMVAVRADLFDLIDILKMNVQRPLPHNSTTDDFECQITLYRDGTVWIAEGLPK